MLYASPSHHRTEKIVKIVVPDPDDDPDDIMAATAREYGQVVADLVQRKRAGQNEARMVAIYLGRQLGGRKHEEIGRCVGLGNTSSVSSAYLAMKQRMAKEKRLARRVRRIEEALIKSKKRT